MKPTTPKTDCAETPMTNDQSQMSKETPNSKWRFGLWSFLRIWTLVIGHAFGFALGLAFLGAPAFADVVGLFKFDNFPTNRAGFTDDTGRGLRGLLGFPFSQPRSVPGPSGLPGDRAVSFDGSGGLAVDDSAAEILNIPTPPLTLECWVRSTNSLQIGVHRALISYGFPGGPPVEGVVRGGYKLGIDPAGNILFTLFAVADVFSGVPFPFDGQWHHVAAAYSFPDDGVHFYLDGVQVAFVPQTGGITPPGSRHLDIGDQATGAGRFDGDIDRVRISTVALTVDQLDSVVGTVKPVGTDTAVFFNFDEPGPPYPGQGRSPAGVAIPAAEWVMNYTPYQSSGGPRPSPSGPVKVADAPSGAGTADLAVGFGVVQFGGAPAVDMAAVWDPKGVLNLNGDWTLEAWVRIKPDFDGARDVIFYYGYPGHGYSLSVNYAPDRLSASLQATTLGIADLPSDPGLASVGIDVWQHLAVVHKNGQSITYFTNGVEAQSRPYTGGTRLAETNKVLYIGAEWDGRLPFTGWIDRIRISDSALPVVELDSNPGNPIDPRLTITRSQSDVILSWPEHPSAFDSLEFSNTLSGSNWQPEPTAPVVVAGQKTVTVPVTGSARYYRVNRSF